MRILITLDSAHHLGFSPEDTATPWDKDHAVAVAEITSTEYDVLSGQYEEWCSMQDFLDELRSKK